MDLVAEYYHLFLMTILVLMVPSLFRALIPYPCAPSTEAVEDTPSRITTFDAVRGVAIIAVILIHVSEILAEMNFGVSTYFLYALNASMRFCIPVFLICSGALLRPLSKKAGAYRAYFSSKIIRIAIPYVIVTILLTAMQGGGVQEMLVQLATGQASVPFYFVLVLFQFYIIYPFIEPFAHSRFFVIATLAITLNASFLPPAYYVAGVPLCIPYTFFFVWGIYMRPSLISYKLPNMWPYVHLVCLAILVYIIFPGHYYNIRPYYGVAMYTLLFAFFAHGNFERIHKFFGWLGTFTLWVFLTHYPLIEYLIPKMSIPTLPIGVQVFGICVASVCVSIAFGYLCTRVYEVGVRTFSRKVLKSVHK